MLKLHVTVSLALFRSSFRIILPLFADTQAEVDRCNEELEKKVAQAEAIAKLMNMKKDNQGSC